MVCHVIIVVGSEACEVAVIEMVGADSDLERRVKFNRLIDRVMGIAGGLEVLSDILPKVKGD